MLKNLILQCIQTFWSDFFNLVIFGDFRNNFRPKMIKFRSRTKILKRTVPSFTLLLSNVNSQKPGSLTFVDGKLTEINLHSGQNKLDALLIKGLVDKIKEHPENILPAGLLDTLEKANPQVGSLRTINRNYCENGVCEVPISLHALWGYGCWCNFGEDLQKKS